MPGDLRSGKVVEAVALGKIIDAWVDVALGAGVDVDVGIGVVVGVKVGVEVMV